MKKHTLRPLLATAVLALVVTGCSSNRQVSQPLTAATVPENQIAMEAPPTPKAELPGVAPGESYAWIPGSWAHINDRWMWVPGHWERSRPGAVWVAGRWDQTDKGWAWVPGRWETRSATAPPEPEPEPEPLPQPPVSVGGAEEP